jgi:segregation and condensation protein B
MSEKTTPSDTSPAPDAAEGAAGPGLAAPPPETISEAHLRSVLESLVFVADRPMTAKELARIARTKKAEVERLLGDVRDETRTRGVQLVEVAGGWQFRSAAANAPFVRDLVAQKPVRLTRAQLETLAIVAYRQPITKPEVEDIRGVDSSSAFSVLLERGLLRILGRKEDVGRPLLYGTAPYFLEFFGLNALTDLPTLKEFTELTEESRVLFERKTGSAFDLGAVAREVDAIEAEHAREIAEAEAEIALADTWAAGTVATSPPDTPE